jgi:hypothetical protein
MKLDPFTSKRIVKFAAEFRTRSGQLPTLQDFEKEGFEKKAVEAAEKAKLIEQFYVTLTNGTILKGYKVKSAE